MENLSAIIRDLGLSPRDLKDVEDISSETLNITAEDAPSLSADDIKHFLKSKGYEGGIIKFGDHKVPPECPQSVTFRAPAFIQI